MYLTPKRFHFLNPIFILFITTNLSVLARAYYMVYSNSTDVKSFLLFGHSYDTFVIGALWIVLSFIPFIVGYSYAEKNLSQSTNYLSINWNVKRLWFSVICLVILAFIGVYFFLTEIGIDNTEAIMGDVSKKRYKNLDDSKYASSMGYLRLLASLSEIATYLIIVYRLSSRRKLGPLGISLLILAFMTSSFFAFFVSSRTALITFALNIAIILYAYRKLSLKLIVTGSISIILVFSLMTKLREEKSGKESTLAKSVEKIIVNRNLLGISRTGIVLNETPKELPFQYGKSLFLWLVSPIPRAVWKNKPAISIAKDIGSNVFKMESRSGVPPGIIAENFINFGYLGFLLMYPFGYIFGIIFQKHRINRNFVEPDKLLIYLILAVNLSTLFFGGTLSQTIVGTLQVLIPTIIISKFVLRKYPVFTVT
ncbi:oligosaccharide repeat unit polymerase [Marinoscillum furvescens]|nr:oligosaccharide repeat unit polymerase [Marinoscillum furvescens]